MTAPPTPGWAEALARIEDSPAARPAGRPGLTRPAAFEYLGRAVAERLTTDKIDLVLSWDRTDDATLGHVVATNLGVDAALVFEPAEGQLAFDWEPAPGQRVAFVGIAFGWRNSVRAPVAFVAGRGARVVRVVALEESPVVQDEVDDVSIILAVSGS